jgi:hypothetical protein
MINEIRISREDHAVILSRFPEAYREKLRMYTGEELYYVYRLMTFKPSPGRELKSGDVFYLALKAKMYRFLRGQDKHPIYPAAWAKLGSKFRFDFHEAYDNTVELEEAIKALKAKFVA